MGELLDFRPAPWLPCPHCAGHEMTAVVIYERGEDGMPRPAHVGYAATCRGCGAEVDMFALYGNGPVREGDQP